ncbi:alpha/beta fold hydrolase [Oligoflexus tunisiensis]|uniref:alpha/beta fold hydrolase n=1 Tax=Oligoflexus tunisiensis TaxID=708132 RepID=UPI00114CD425|nr:alpha/beta hydrolase [Oligoflexus tunisiensis]
MKHAPYQLLLAWILAACGANNPSHLAESTDRMPSIAAAPAQIAEADFENQFDTYVLPLMAQGESAYFTGVGGKQIHFFRLEHPSARAGVVISHGFGESILKYRESIYNLYALGYSVYIWEHRGHAHSDRLLADRYKTHVDDFDHYVDDMQIFMNTRVPHDKPLFLFAHSMGGAIALAWLERHPGVFQAAVMNAPLLELNTAPYPGWIARGLAGLLDFAGRDEDYAPGQKTFTPEGWVFEKASTSSRVRFERNRTDNLAEDLAMGGVTVKWLRETLKATRHLTKRNTIRQVTTPILMFQAGRDTFVKPEAHDRFCAQAADCTLIKVQEARHEIFNETDAIRLPFWDKAAQFYESHL